MRPLCLFTSPPTLPLKQHSITFGQQPNSTWANVAVSCLFLMMWPILAVFLVVFFFILYLAFGIHANYSVCICMYFFFFLICQAFVDKLAPGLHDCPYLRQHLKLPCWVFYLTLINLFSSVISLMHCKNESIGVRGQSFHKNICFTVDYICLWWRYNNGCIKYCHKALKMTSGSCSGLALCTF